MSKTIGGFALFLLIGFGTAAEAAPWCAFYGSSTYNCGFYSYQQCLATVSGTGGYCRQNFFEGYGRPGKRPRGDRY